MSFDRGIAVVLNDAGIGDFSPPNTAIPPCIVIGQSRETPEELITVLPAAGDAPAFGFGRNPKVKILTRDPSYAVARDRANEIYELLDQFQGALDGMPCGRIQPDGLPDYDSRDASGREGGLAVFSQTFTIFTHDL